MITGQRQALVSRFTTPSVEAHCGAKMYQARNARAVGSDQWLLSVVNGGNAIPSDALTKVFEPYWRPATSTPGGGLGLGLYICKQIVLAHAGSIEYRYEAPYVIFRVTLPAAAPAVAG